MLAPRKTLWSTPDSVTNEIVRNVRLSSKDVVMDVGCGNGVVLITWAIAISAQNIEGDDFPSFCGIDIDSDRIEEARNSLIQARKNGDIHPNLSVTFTCGNVLENCNLLASCTVLYMYLIPRGLRLMLPILKELQATNSGLRVITYMSPLPNVKVTRHETIQVPHQPGAAWPLYFYDSIK